jgi:hypothetical protein
MSTHLLLHEEFQPQQAFRHHATTLVITKLQVWDLRVQALVQWHLLHPQCPGLLLQSRVLHLTLHSTVTTMTTLVLITTANA